MTCGVSTAGREEVSHRAEAWRPLLVRGPLVPAGIAVIATLITYARVPARGRNTLYAEDGRVFVGDWLRGPDWRVPFRPYMGYQHLLPRITSGVVTSVLPVQTWATAMTLAACMFVGAGAALVYVLSEDVVAAPAARLGLAAVMVLSPLASIEAVGNMANLHWYLLYLMPWVLLAVPRSARGAVTLGALALVATMTEVQCVLFAPLAVLMWVRRRQSRVIVTGWALGSFVQLVTFLVAPRARHSGVPTVSAAVKGYVLNAWLSNGSAEHVDVGGFVRSVGWWLAGGTLLVFLAFAGYAWWRGSLLVRIAVVTVVLASAASWFASYYENNSPLYNYDAISHARLPHAPLVRWGTAAAMLLVAVLPLAAGVFAGRRPRLQLVPALGMVAMATVMCLALSSSDNPRGGTRWGSAVKSAAALCRTSQHRTVEIPTTPRGWSVEVPCSALR